MGLRRGYEGVTKGIKGKQGLVTVSGRSRQRDKFVRNPSASPGFDATLATRSRGCLTQFRRKPHFLRASGGFSCVA
jgi:hypothetical protein